MFTQTSHQLSKVTGSEVRAGNKGFTLSWFDERVKYRRYTVFVSCVCWVLFDYYSFEFLHQDFWTQGGNFASLVAYFFNVRKV